MSAGSSIGCSQLWRNATSHGWQPQFGPLTGLPIIPCPRCGDRVLELRMSDGVIFFKCRQNDQDVPAALRKSNFYKLSDEYEQVLVSRGYGQLIGVSMTQPQNVGRAQPRYVQQTHGRCVEENCNPKLQEKPKMEDTNLSAKMNKLIKLGKLILFSLVVLVVLVSLGLLVIILK